MKPCILRPASEHPWPGHVGLDLQAALVARPDIRIDDRSRFVFQDRHLLALLNGRKRSTIRYTPGAIERVLRDDLPVCVDRINRNQVREIHEIGNVTVSSILYKEFGSIDLLNAVDDGFHSVIELRTALEDIYGPIEENALVTIFYLADTNNLVVPPAD